VFDLDGSGKADISTGIGFFDHMLDLLARHSLMDLTIRCEGDLHIDDHHSVEDTGIALGQAILHALGDKKGIARYACVHLPMDEALTRVAVDVSGRPFLVSARNLPSPKSVLSTPSWCVSFSGFCHECRPDFACRNALR